MNTNPWLLPDGIEEILAPEAKQIEQLRRQLLDHYRSWGYQLVMTPMVEYLDSLLTGTAHSLQLQTFTVVDQISGKQMGIRSDMTPQVARLDAHLLSANSAINRVSYCGHLLHTKPSGVNMSRAPLQIGAEIFGSETLQSDIEVVSLMIETLQLSGIKQVSVDLGHVGIFSQLMQQFGLNGQQEKQLFDKLQRKSIPEINNYLQELSLDADKTHILQQLAWLNGDLDTIKHAKKLFAIGYDDILQYLSNIETVAQTLQRAYPDVDIHCDLSELRGYEYHTGLVFSAFVAGQGTEIARGGRYDNVGALFGEARPATGFSTDLIALQRLSSQQATTEQFILAPQTDDEDCCQLIKQLRAQGHVVIVDVSQGQQTAKQQNCNKIILKQGSQWLVKEE